MEEKERELILELDEAVKKLHQGVKLHFHGKLTQFMFFDLWNRNIKEVSKTHEKYYKMCFPK